jgi:amphi-Trp domain-containing protein
VSDKTAFEYSDTVSGEQIADYLSQIADGLRRGSMTFEGQGQQIALCPTSTVKMEIKAESRDGKGELQLEVSWKPETATASDGLQVLSGAEVVEPVAETPVETTPAETPDA